MGLVVAAPRDDGELPHDSRCCLPRRPERCAYLEADGSVSKLVEELLR